MNFARSAARSLALVAALVLGSAAGANGEDPLAQHLWTARPVVIFADAPQDPRFVRQMQELERAADALEERDVVILVDTEPPATRAEASPLRARFRPHGFNVIVVAKDGQIILRRPNVVTGAQLTRLIDRMPMRQQEIGRR